MNKRILNKRLDRALNYIDDDLISEAADYVPKKKAKPINLFKYSAAAACCAAAIAGVIALKSVIITPDAFLENPSTSSDYIFSNIDPIISQSGASGSASTSKDIPSSSPPVDDPDGFPETPDHEDLLKLTNDPNIVWAAETKAGDIKSDWTKPGTTKISDELSAEIQKDPNAVHAVMVSFEPCRNDTEMEKWKFDGTTIGEIKYQIKMISLKSEQAANNSDTSPNKDTESVDETQMLQYLRDQLTNAVYDYYFTKVSGFLGTFSTNGLLIYPVTVGVEDTDLYNRFFCFASGSQLESFTCKENEAFIFYTLTKETFLKYA